MSRREAIVKAAGAAAAVWVGQAGAASAQGFGQMDELSQMPLDAHGWLPAATVDGGVGWNVLGATAEREARVNGQLWIVPEFTERVRRLDGQRIRVNGFMLPLEETPRQRRFLLMAYPTSCPWHLDVGPAFCIDVRSPQGVAHTYDAMVVEGRMELLEQDPEGLFYRMTEARKL